MMEDESFKIQINGETFVSETRTSQKSGKTYDAFDAFGGLCFVSFLEERDDKPAAIVITLSKDVNIPRPAGSGSKGQTGKSNGGGNSNFKSKPAAAATKPKKTEPAAETGDSPW